MKYSYHETGFGLSYKNCSHCNKGYKELASDSYYRYLYYTKSENWPLICKECISSFENIDVDWAVGLYSTTWDDYKDTKFLCEEMPF